MGTGKGLRLGLGAAGVVVLLCVSGIVVAPSKATGVKKCGGSQMEADIKLQVDQERSTLLSTGGRTRYRAQGL